ncbi:coiled-coil domain-containing protein 24 isoform X2 [Anomaloglossus baeobatrachus]|uniref:coiled-coil domain-containing protein 24 isoform X2 n=1 Tax=Anomaloglossus baeobatrachus TaxID=238106 RepID=UPI003F4FEB7E
MLRPGSDRDSGYGDLLEPPPSVWRLVEEQVPPSERAEMKRILGEAAIDLSLDLHAEVAVLLELCRDVQSTCPSSGRCTVLADPPVIKDMVTQEIRMLLLSVRMRARHQGIDEDLALCKYSPRVLSFVMGSGPSESRVRSRGEELSRPPSGSRARSRGEELSWPPSRSRARSRGEELSRPSSGCRAMTERSGSALSTGSSIEDDLEELRGKLQMSHIDEVTLHLQSLVEEECKSLEQDISILQRLEDERRCMEETLPAEPSLTELKEERRILERDLQLPAPSAPTIKVDATRTLDFRNRGAIADCRLSLKLPIASDLPQDPPVTLCPPNLKLLRCEGTVGKSCLGPRAPSCAEERRLSNSGSELQSVEWPPIVSSVQCAQGRGPVPAPCISPDTTVLPRAAVIPENYPLLPLPPKVQRPPGGSGLAFRRVRTQMSNLPPERNLGRGVVKHRASNHLTS